MSSKAIIGGYGIDSDWIIIAEIRRLLEREKELEQQIARLREENASFEREAKEVLVHRQIASDSDEPVKRLEEIAATVGALTEVVAKLAADSASIPENQFADYGDDELERLMALADSRPALAGALRASCGEEQSTEMHGSGSWRSMAAIVGVGSLLDLNGRATAAALESVYNQARVLAAGRSYMNGRASDPSEDSGMKGEGT
ncbi:hypothetical protein [Streptomyces sp. NPDC047968]|uniref:hypothetical protein n=1 Tax=unclassified Streptomyces TaxID=2593676 RepID=UPI00342E6075